MGLAALPDELIDQCFRGLDRISLRSVRLVDRHLTTLATEHLFSEVVCRATETSAQHAFRILENVALNPLVTRLSLVTHPDPVPEDYGQTADLDIPEAYASLLLSIGRFRSLRAAELQYSDQCHAEGTRRPWGGDSAGWESTARRRKLLALLVQGLNHPDHPAEKVQELMICNLQDIVDKTLATSSDFLTVLSRLNALSLQIVIEYNDVELHRNLCYPEAHRFFGKDLRQYWLEPIREHLVHLHLSVNTPDTYWGYLPYCNLPGLHFPRLQSLSLQKMTFTHDWQVHWIASHGMTLQRLTLQDCPIVHEGRADRRLGADRYLVNPRRWPAEGEDDVVSDWRYDARWHSHLRRLQHGLPRLKGFHLGYDVWRDEGLLEDAACAPARMDARRYYVLDQTTGDAWFGPHIDYPGDPLEYTFSGHGYREDAPLYPDCEQEDADALRELMEIVCSRR